MPIPLGRVTTELTSPPDDDCRALSANGPVYIQFTAPFDPATKIHLQPITLSYTTFNQSHGSFTTQRILSIDRWLLFGLALFLNDLNKNGNGNFFVPLFFIFMHFNSATE